MAAFRSKALSRDDFLGVAIIILVALAGLGSGLAFTLWQDARVARAVKETQVIETTEELQELLQSK
ncbi:hypothetical protein C7293_04975 [filamentous cyanobacterium CCT1]|nr:hypothetical protein C7293_04975 [filamentous cyanobacterium CCT1]